VFTVFGIKRFADFIHVPANVQWLFWGRRDFLFFLIGLGAFTVLWLGHRRRQRGLSPVVLSRSKRTLSFMVTFAVLAIGWQIATTGNWPYGWLQTTFLFVAVTYVIFHLVKDFWSWWRTRRKQEQVSREVVVHHKSGRSAGANLFWGMVGGLMFLLSASFAGSIEGRQTAAGCGYAKAIVFNPLPPKIDGNKTYWLTVHIGGIYYIREAPPGKADHAILVPESPSTVVALQPVSRPADCPL
jgi:hypothetical protein